MARESEWPSGIHPGTPCGCAMARAASDRLDGNLRSAETVTDIIPLKSPLVALIRFRAGKIAYASNVGDKRAIAGDVRPEDRFVVAWPGRYRQDVFDATPAWVREHVGGM